MRKTYKYRLYPSTAQEAKLLATLEVCRILYNSCLVDRKNHHESTGKGLSRIQQQKILAVDKKRVPLLKEVHSQVLQDVLFRVERACQGFFRRLAAKEGKAGYPRFKSEGRYDSITYPQEPGFKIEENKLKLSKIGHLKIRMHREIVGQVKTCTIRKDGAHWHACFSTEYEAPARPVPTKPIGIDVGLKSFAALSDGTEIANPKYLRKAEARLKRSQRALSRKRKGGGNRKKAKRVVTNLHRKVKNQRLDFHHKEARKIVKRKKPAAGLRRSIPAIQASTAAVVVKKSPSSWRSGHTAVRLVGWYWIETTTPPSTFCKELPQELRKVTPGESRRCQAAH